MSVDLLETLLHGLPDSAVVLDVGGWASPHPRADWVLDLGPYETRDWYETLGAPPRGHAERFTAESWVVHDICAPGAWPLADEQFDFAICSHTLEDVRDPVKVCSELARVARAGYIETPAAVTELTRGIESQHWCGWRHHRWLVEPEGQGLLFLGKPHHVHSQVWPSVRSPRLLCVGAAEPLRLAWHGDLPAREEFHVDPVELDARLAAIIAAAAQPDPAGKLQREALTVVYGGYRSARARAGRAYRAIVSSTMRSSE